MDTWTAKMAALKIVAVATALTVLGPAAGGRADTIQTGYLFASDYGRSELDRFQYTYNQTTNKMTGITPYGSGGSTSSAYFLGGGQFPVKEGLQGTGNDLIIVGGVHGSAVTTFSRYTLEGAFIGQIPVDFSGYNGGNVGIGNVVATPDGHYIYAPLEGAGYVVKIDLSNGAIVGSAQLANAHDVALAADGTVYAANYNAASAKLVALNANLDAASMVVLASANPSGVSGSFRPSGISVASDGSLYVNDNTRGGSDSILHYTVSSTGGTLSATYDATRSYAGSPTNNALEFLFGNNIGPDGLIYVAALGGGGSGSFSTRDPYVDGIYAFDPGAGTVSRAVAGFSEKGGTFGPSGLAAPKYLQFDVNFITANDVGVPEPATLALLVTALAGLGLRRRAAARHTMQR